MTCQCSWLTLCEACGAIVLVPEAITFSQVVKLSSQNTGEGWADKSRCDRSLGYTSREQVNVINVPDRKYN